MGGLRSLGAFPGSVFLGCLFFLVKGQHVDFQNVSVPRPGHILSISRFFAFNKNDPPWLSWRGTPVGLSHLPEVAYDMALSVYHGNEKGDAENKSVGVIPQKPAAEKEEGGGSWFNWFTPRRPRAAEDENKSKDAEEKAQGVIATPPMHTNETYVIFRDITLSIEDGVESPERSVVQFTVLHYDDFESFFLHRRPDGSTPRFCCTPADVVQRLCRKDQSGLLLLPDDMRPVASLTMGLKNLMNETQLYISSPLDRTAAYILLFSNCAESVVHPVSGKVPTVSGEIYLKNYYGYLPGTEASKVTLYLISLFIVAKLVYTWAYLLFRYRTQLIKLHHCISVVLFLALLEIVLHFIFYRVWNVSVRRVDRFFHAVMVVSVAKNAASLMLALVACKGWGTISPRLEASTKQKIALFSIAYLLFDCTRQIVTNVREAYQFPLLVVLACVFPASLLNSVAFLWIFTSLDELMRELRRTNQTQKLQRFLKFHRVIMVAIITEVCILMLQIVTISRDGALRWRHDWVLSDAAPTLLYICVLGALMLLWKPSRNSKAMAYSEQLPLHDTELELSIAGPDVTSVGKGYSARQLSLDGSTDGGGGFDVIVDRDIQASLKL